MNLFRTIDIARAALIARRAEMEAVSQNVANASTPGYHRRRVEFSSIRGETGGHIPRSGMGVATASTKRLGDRMLEAQIGIETGDLGREQAKATALFDLE